MIVQCKVLVCEAKIPTRATDGSAGYDLSSIENVLIDVGSRRLISTGITMKIPKDSYGRIAPRSGLSLHYCLDIGAGVIDSDYTGEIKVLLINNGSSPFQVTCGDRIAQIIFERIYLPEMRSVTSIDETERSSNGFGSTGLKQSSSVQERE